MSGPFEPLGPGRPTAWRARFPFDGLGLWLSSPRPSGRDSSPIPPTLPPSQIARNGPLLGPVPARSRLHPLRALTVDCGLPETDAIFANVQQVREQVRDEPETLEISMDAKAKVALDAYVRGGKNPD